MQLRQALWAYVRRLRARGTTIVLTTHYLEEAENLCDRIGVIDHGKLLTTGTLAELKAAVGDDTVLTFTFSGDTEELAGKAQHAEAVTTAEHEGDVLRLHTKEPERALEWTLQTASELRLPLQDVQIMRPSLETVFLSLTGREYRE